MIKSHLLYQLSHGVILSILEDFVAPQGTLPFPNALQS